MSRFNTEPTRSVATAKDKELAEVRACNMNYHEKNGLMGQFFDHAGEANG